MLSNVFSRASENVFVPVSVLSALATSKNEKYPAIRAVAQGEKTQHEAGHDGMRKNETAVGVASEVGEREQASSTADEAIPATRRELFIPSGFRLLQRARDDQITSKEARTKDSPVKQRKAQGEKTRLGEKKVVSSQQLNRSGVFFFLLSDGRGHSTPNLEVFYSSRLRFVLLLVIVVVVAVTVRRRPAVPPERGPRGRHARCTRRQNESRSSSGRRVELFGLWTMATNKLRI